MEDTMSHNKVAIAVAVAAALLSGAANAQAQEHGDAHNDFERSVRYSQYLGTEALRASELIGATVRNRDGTDLGEIEDLMVSRSGDDVVTAVLSVGGILGIGEKRIGVPYDELRVSETGDSFYLSATEEELTARPAFQYPERREVTTRSSNAGDSRDVDATPEPTGNRGIEDRGVEQNRAAAAAEQHRIAEQNAREQEQSARVVTDTPPSTSRSPSHDVRTMERAASRASNIIGTTVTDNRGEDLGEIDDLVVTPQGRLEAVLSVGGVLGIGERLIAVPMEELMIERRDDNEMQVRMNTTASELLDHHPEFRYEPQAAVH
jgi:sporulation protein YlmC with PRC-barrel domain